MIREVSGTFATFSRLFGDFSDWNRKVVLTSYIDSLRYFKNNETEIVENGFSLSIPGRSGSLFLRVEILYISAILIAFRYLF